MRSLVSVVRAPTPHAPHFDQAVLEGAEETLRLPVDQVDPDELRMVARLEVHPGDVVVLTSPRKVAPEERELLLAGARAELPAGVRVLLLEEGVGVAILAPSQLREPPLPSSAGASSPRGASAGTVPG